MCSCCAPRAVPFFACMRLPPTRLALCGMCSWCAPPAAGLLTCPGSQPTTDMTGMWGRGARAGRQSCRSRCRRALQHRIPFKPIVFSGAQHPSLQAAARSPHYHNCDAGSILAPAADTSPDESNGKMPYRRNPVLLLCAVTVQYCWLQRTVLQQCHMSTAVLSSGTAGTLPGPLWSAALGQHVRPLRCFHRPSQCTAAMLPNHLPRRHVAGAGPAQVAGCAPLGQPAGSSDHPLLDPDPPAACAACPGASATRSCTAAMRRDVVISHFSLHTACFTCRSVADLSHATHGKPVF